MCVCVSSAVRAHQLVVVLAAVAVASAQIRPSLVSSRDRDAVILKQTYEPNPDGSYIYK